MERDPERRCVSVDELSADLERHLKSQPVLTGPPSAGYRVRKFVRRHVAGVAAASAFLVVIVGFAVTMTIQARRIVGERDRAEAEAAKAEAERLSAHSVSLVPLAEQRSDVTTRSGGRVWRLLFLRGHATHGGSFRSAII